MSGVRCRLVHIIYTFLWHIIIVQSNPLLSLYTQLCLSPHPKASSNPPRPFPHSFAARCHFSISFKLVSVVVPQTLHSCGAHFSNLHCKTTYSSTSFSFPLPSTKLPLTVLLNFCVLLILTTACLSAFPPPVLPGICAILSLTTLLLPLYLDNSHLTLSVLCRPPIRALILSNTPSVHISFSFGISPSANAVYIF